jgi:hypothetical protein
MTARHIRDLARLRRLAVLMATAIRMEADLTDSALAMFDKLMGTLSRRAENRTAEKTLNSVRDTQAQLRTLVTACQPIINAREAAADPFEAIDKSVGWLQFVTCVAGVEALSRPGATDAQTEFLTRYPTIRAFAPSLLNAFEFKGGSTVTPLLRAIDITRAMYLGGNSLEALLAPRMRGGSKRHTGAISKIQGDGGGLGRNPG